MFYHFSCKFLKLKYSFRSLVTILLISLVAGGCKENTLISSKIAPSVDNIMVFGDSLPILARTVYDDSVVTSTNFSGLPVYQGIGTVNDPYFGKTNAATFFQIIPSTPNFKFEGFTVDSAILVLPYAGFTWGDTSGATPTQSMVVYRVSSILEKNATYYPYTQKDIDFSKQYSDVTPVNISRLRDSVSIWGVNRTPHVRIRLNQSFINDITTADKTNFEDYPKFLEWFRGLCVMPADTNQNGRAMPYFRLDGTGNYSQANVLFYYHTPGGNDTLTMTFPFSQQYCVLYNKITRNYTGAPAQAYINTPGYNNDLILLQNQPGAALDIKIPNISKIPQAVINRAELVISVAQQDNIFSPPAKLFPMGVRTGDNGNNYVYYVADRYPLNSISPLSVIDGYAKKVNNVTTYKINIPRELQSAINQKRDTLHLRIIGTQDYYGAYRMIAGGNTNSDPNLRIRFNVVLTKLN